MHCSEGKPNQTLGWGEEQRGGRNGPRTEAELFLFRPEKEKGILNTFPIKLITEMIFELLKILPMLK